MDLKTPISLLQEYLVKEGVLPSYQLINFGGATNAPCFGYEVKAKGVSAVGKGRSKKEAKQEAAKALLLQLKGEKIWKEEIPIISPHIPSVSGNSIGALQEYCMQNTIPCPHYDFVGDEGDLSSHMFVVRCTVDSYSAHGRASTKQQAKHLAAQAVLSMLHNVKENINNMSSSVVTEKKELTTMAYNKTLEAFQKTLHERQDRPISSTNTTKNLLNFADYFRNKIGPRSSALNSIKNLCEEELEKHKDPEGLLSLIMSQLGYRLLIEFLNSKSSDYYLCNYLVSEISINCIGAAKCKHDAKKNAAINVLKVLLVMSKQ